MYGKKKGTCMKRRENLSKYVYQKPTIDVINFDDADIIATSPLPCHEGCVPFSDFVDDLKVEFN